MNKKIFTFVMLGLLIAPWVGAAEKPSIITWRILRKLKKRNHIPPIIQRFNGKQVLIRGYMVPLEGDSVGDVTEFLLVPAAGMCIHLPPPPANQMVFVRMKKDKKASHTWQAVKVTGKLKVSTRTHQYGAAHYEITAERVK